MGSLSTSSDTIYSRRVRVLLPLPLAGAYDYLADPAQNLEPGDLVRVPLGPRTLTGAVWDPEPGPGSGKIGAARLKPVGERLDVPPLPGNLRRLIDWVAAYTVAPPGAVLRMAMSTPEAFAPAKPVTVFGPGGAPPARLTAARRRVLAAAAQGGPRSARDLAAAAGVSPGVVAGLAKTGALRSHVVARDPGFARPDPETPRPPLSPEQQTAADGLAGKVAAQEFSANLLEGVAGAGKTEVYFEAIAEALRLGRDSLVLVPEIALTAQWLDRFEARFGVAPAEWHSDLTRRERRRVWRAVAEGRAPVVVGARSALFLPFANLGLIAVDEEHDASFKQEDGVHYNARDMAVVRAREAAVPIVLVSATPSLETVVNVRDGRFDHYRLRERHGSAELPATHVLDMRADALPADRWVSPVLAAALRETVAAGEQALLFLNRRGYAPLTLCRACGHRLECPNCQAWLVEHRHAGRLQCHHCGHAQMRPPDCPSCGEADRFAACGPGVERIAEEAAAIVPEARLAIMASDTLSGPRAAADFVRRVVAHEVDVLIGTQILAKGHHFPLLTLVGVVDADLGLGGGDLRAAERTFQLLTQVAGRAGREERPGRVYLQTYMPEHAVMRALASGDAERFIASEADARKEFGLPPFGRLAALIVSGENERSVRATAQALGRATPRGSGIEALGPAPAPLALLRGRHRQRLLLKTPRSVNVQSVVRKWIAQVSVPGGVRLQIDIDPYSFL
jgi:primosomal protein N' (replication factor Y)